MIQPCKSILAPIRSRSGFSLVETLVVVGVMGIIMGGMMTLQSHQSKEVKALSEQLAKSELDKNLISVFADGTICSFMFANGSSVGLSPVNATFDASTLPKKNAFTLNQIPLRGGSSAPIAQINQQASASSNSLYVNSIYVNVVQKVDANHYLATLNVSFDPARTVRAVPDLSYPMLLQTSGANANTSISSCAMTNGSGSPNYVPLWESSTSMKNSNIYQDPATLNVGVGTTTPQATLEVNGAIKMGYSNTCSPGAIRYNPNATGTMEFCDNTSAWKGMGGISSCTIVPSGWGASASATCPAGKILTGGSCEMQRGGDGRVIGTRSCVPSGQTMTCSEGNSGVCRTYAICCS